MVWIDKLKSVLRGKKKKTQVFYLDENHNFVPKKKAKKGVMRILDEEGNLEREVWFVVPKKDSSEAKRWKKE